MQFTYSNANFFLGWYIWFCPLRREDKSWALVERKKTFDIPNKLTQNLRPNRYAYSNTQFKSSYTLHPQKHRQHAQGAHGGYKKERDQIRIKKVEPSRWFWNKQKNLRGRYKIETDQIWTP